MFIVVSGRSILFKKRNLFFETLKKLSRKKFKSILTHIYYRNTNIYAIKSFLPLYGSLISVGWTNNEIHVSWYYFPLAKICAQWDSLCNPLLLLYKIVVYFILLKLFSLELYWV